MFIPNANPNQDVSEETKQQIIYNDNLESARRRFDYKVKECNMTEFKDKDLSKWNLADYVKEAQCIANHYSITLNEVYGLDRHDLQTATSKDTDEEIFTFIKHWRSWQNFYIDFKNSVPRDMQPNSEHYIDYVEV